MVSATLPEILSPEAAAEPGKTMARRSPRHLAASITLCVIGVALIYPLIDVIIASFRLQGTGQFTLQYWRAVFHQIPVWRELGMSALVTGASVAGVLVVSVPAGYAYAKLSFRGARAIFGITVACMMIPVESMIIPEYSNLAKVGLVGSVLGTVLVFVGLGIPLSVFLMASYFKSLPDALLESGLVDGAGHLRIFLSIMLPLALPAIVTIGVLEFLAVWNDLLIALLFLPIQSHTIAVGLAALQGNHILNTYVLVAGSVLSAIPPMIVYMLFQRKLVAGLTMGVNR